MRLTDLGNDPKIAEQIPTSVGMAPPMPAAGQPAPAGQLGQQSLQQTNPATAALAAKQQQEQKRQLQHQIRQTEKQLQDLRKQLAQL